MIAQQIKESLKTLTPTELLELKQSVDEMCAPLQILGPEMDRKARILKAKREIFTEYDSLLSELAK